MKYHAVCGLVLAGAVVGFGAAGPLQDGTYTFPVIKDYGKVVQMKNAAQQPRDGSRLVVDITAGNEPQELNSAIEKVCRFVNIYAGAGKEPAKVEIAVVIHGAATLSVLEPDAYAARFQVTENPTLKVIKTLRKAGVRFYVCGQSLVGKGAKPEEVYEDVEVAVSALTSLTNLQADGYAFIPLGN